MEKRLQSLIFQPHVPGVVFPFCAFGALRQFNRPTSANCGRKHEWTILPEFQLRPGQSLPDSVRSRSAWERAAMLSWMRGHHDQVSANAQDDLHDLLGSIPSVDKYSGLVH
jgi:hypothetical protein